MNEIEFLLRLHQQLCGIADAIMYYHDPCQFDTAGCVRGAYPAWCCHRSRFARADGADIRCQFLGDRGCLNENIECKCFLCDVATARADPECLRALAAVQAIAKMYGLIK